MTKIISKKYNKDLRFTVEKTFFKCGERGLTLPVNRKRMIIQKTFNIKVTFSGMLTRVGPAV